MPQHLLLWHFSDFLFFFQAFIPLSVSGTQQYKASPSFTLRTPEVFRSPFFSMAASAVCSPPLPLDRINLLIEIIIYQTWKIYKFIIFSYIYRVFLYFHEGYYNSFPESPQCNLCRCPSRFIPAKPFCRRAS